MPQELGSGLATSLLQVLMLIFAGFATLLIRIYETSPEDMEPDGPEILGWVFMSYSISFIYPIFVLTLVLLLGGDNGLARAVIYLLGAFISIPVLILSLINFYKGLKNDDDINWRPYQRTINCISGIAVWATFIISIYHLVLPDIIHFISYYYL